MSTLETILTRMISDSAFADALFADAEKALAEYNLSAEDLAKFKGMSRAQFEAMNPEERKSFGSFHGSGGVNHNQTALHICN